MYLAVLGVLLSALAACGGGDAGVPAGGGYFATVDTHLEDFRAASGEEFDTLRSSADLQELKAAAADMITALDSFIASVDGLEPPAEATEVHRAALADSLAYRARLAEVNQSAQSATTVEELRDVMVDRELQARFEAFNANCQRLQEAADNERADVDFDCPA